MRLKEILYDEIYYYTDVFEDVDNIIATIEELDNFEESYAVISK
jgi:cephalosporin-C deacetylase-like acetyl esterase